MRVCAAFVSDCSPLHSTGHSSCTLVRLALEARSDASAINQNLLLSITYSYLAAVWLLGQGHVQSVVRVPWRAYMSTLPNEIVAAVFAAPTLELGTMLLVEAADDEQAQYVDSATIHGRAGGPSTTRKTRTTANSPRLSAPIFS